MFWALASLGYTVDAATLDVLEARALVTLPDSSPHSLSNIAWATAKLRPSELLVFKGPASKLLRKLVNQIEAQSTKFNGQGLATVVRAQPRFLCHRSVGFGILWFAVLHSFERHRFWP